MSCRSHANCAASFASSPPVFSLYFQCAAMPSSAVRCISWVRICTSMRRWPGPMTVVWSDWYMFGFGSAM